MRGCLAVLTMLAGMLTACGGVPATATVDPRPTQTRAAELAQIATLSAPTVASVATATTVPPATAVPTATPVAPATVVASATAVPTATPVPTATSVPTRTAALTTTPASVSAPSAETVIARLKAAGLPIGEVAVYNAETDPNKRLGRPGQYIGKANFRDTRLPATPEVDIGGGGSIEIFATEVDLQSRRIYVETIARSSPLLNEYDFVAGLVLLRLASDLTPGQAAAYREAIGDAAKP